MKRDLLIYLSGPYSARLVPGISPENEGIIRHSIIRQNIDLARDFGIKIWEMGYTAIVPHLNNAFFEERGDLSYEDMIKGDLTILSRCDGLFMLPGWKDSKGAKIERREALNQGIRVFYSLDELLLWERDPKDQLKLQY